MTATLPVTPAGFRTDFPAFASLDTYPDGQVQFWLDLATALLRVDVYGPVLPQATELFVAHNLALEQMNVVAASAGGAPVGPVGLLASRAVGPVSKSYDNSGALEPDAGHWALTTYGSRFLRLGRLRAARPLAVGPCGVGPSAAAWPGPWSGRAPWGAG